MEDLQSYLGEISFALSQISSLSLLSVMTLGNQFEEPDAGNPQVRFCEGLGRKRPRLLDACLDTLSCFIIVSEGTLTVGK